MKVLWAIDEIMKEKHDDVGFPSIEEAVIQAGHEVMMTKYIPFSQEPDLRFYSLPEGRPLICYGSTAFIRQLDRPNGFGLPGFYCKKDALKYSSYSHIYGDKMINSEYIMLPYGEVKRRYKSGSIFIRPDVVTKSFAGKVIDCASQEENPTILGTYDHISDNEMCVIAEPQFIHGEYRHVICERKVIAQSQYRREMKLDIRTDVEPICQELAEWIAAQEYQIDSVYVVDTALTFMREAKIVEFNAFSCSGFYAMDTVEIVRKVSEAAIREYNGDDIEL